jgi:YD repeat-containing protein
MKIEQRDAGPRGVRSFAFDQRGRLVSFTSPDGETTRFEYDGDRRTIRIADDDGRVHELEWNSQRTLVETRDTATGPRMFSYENRAVRPVPPDYAFLYDQPGVSVTTYTYDESGRIQGPELD